MKAYLREMFVENKQTTLLGLSAIIADASSFSYEWAQAAAKLAPEASRFLAMPDPKSAAAGIFAGLCLIFWAHDPRKSP